MALHLGLDHHAAQIVSHLFSQGGLSFNAATVVSLIFAVLGTLPVVTSLQEIYEKCSTSRTGDCGIFTESSSGFSRCAQSPVSWARSAAQSEAPGGSCSRNSLPSRFSRHLFGGHRSFIGWSSPMPGTFPAAVATAIFALLLGAFSRVYFSSTIIADDRTYGAIGAVFSLMTWLTAVGVVIILGSVAGGAWHERSSRRCGERAQETIA